jgi:hypothetical protein
VRDMNAHTYTHAHIQKSRQLVHQSHAAIIFFIGSRISGNLPRLLWHRRQGEIYPKKYISIVNSIYSAIILCLACECLGQGGWRQKDMKLTIRAKARSAGSAWRHWFIIFWWSIAGYQIFRIFSTPVNVRAPCHHKMTRLLFAGGGKLRAYWKRYRGKKWGKRTALGLDVRLWTFHRKVIWVMKRLQWPRNSMDSA